jgi:hypothetical protein
MLEIGQSALSFPGRARSIEVRLCAKAAGCLAAAVRRFRGIPDIGRHWRGMDVQRMTRIDRLLRDFGATQHEQSAAGVRLLAKLHRDNRRLHLYDCFGVAVSSGRLSCRAFFEPFKSSHL